MKPAFKFVISFVAAVLLGGGLAVAKDVATEQHNVAAASKAVDEAKSDYDAAAERVRQQSQKIAQEENRLKTEKKALAEAKARYEKAQAELAEQRKKLDQAWDKK